MAKFYGSVGFTVTKEEPYGSGIWVETIEEKPYYGDILGNSRRWETSGINDNVVVNMTISIIADPYAFENYQNMRYVKWADGVKWKVSSIDGNEYPRLVLSLGGKYNE